MDEGWGECKTLSVGRVKKPCTNWIDIKVYQIRDAKVDDLPIGMVADDRDALIRGLYGTLAEYPCDECGGERDMICYKGWVLCACCVEKEYEKEDKHDSQSPTPD